MIPEGGKKDQISQPAVRGGSDKPEKSLKLKNGQKMSKKEPNKGKKGKKSCAKGVPRKQVVLRWISQEGDLEDKWGFVNGIRISRGKWT